MSSTGREPKKLAWFGIRWTKALRDAAPKWDTTLRAILYTLATYMDNTTGEAIVSGQTLAKGAGCNRYTVSRRLTRAFAEEELGTWLQREMRRNAKGHKYYVYRGLIPGTTSTTPVARDAHGMAKPRAPSGKPVAQEAGSHVRRKHTNYLHNYPELEAVLQKPHNGRLPPPGVVSLLNAMSPSDRGWAVKNFPLLSTVNPDHIDAELLDSALRANPTEAKALLAQIENSNDGAE